MFQSPAQSDARALRHPDNRRVRDIETVEQLVDIVHILRDARHTGRTTETAPVECDHVISIGEQIDLCSPHIEVERPPVYQHDGRSFSSAAHPQGCALHFDVSLGAQCRPHNRLDAIAAPSASDFSLR